MRTPVWPLAAMLLGLALLVLVPLILAATPAQTYWSDADQAQYQRASADFHAAAYSLPSSEDGTAFNRPRPGYDPVAAKAKYSQAKAEWERQSTRLQAVQSRRHWLLWGLRLIGAGLTVAGIIGYLRSKRG